jgi:large subunit ribosomal protein L18
MKRIEDKRRKRLKRKRHIRKKVQGTPDRPRLSVFKSNRHLYAQVIDDSAGATLASVSNLETDLRQMKVNVEDAGKIGELLGKRILEKQISRVVFDRNGYAYHGVVKALADGARKAGVEL